MSDGSHSNSLVSICVPAYNCEKTVEKTLDSIVAQTYSNVEIIVGNNDSTDQTDDIIGKFSRKHQIRYVVNGPGLLGEDNFNKLSGMARGNLVSVYHSDDIYHPEIVEKCVNVFSHNKQVGVVFTMARVIDENDDRIGHYHFPKELRAAQKGSYDFDDIFGLILKYSNSFLVCPSAMFRKEVFDKFGGWDFKHYRTAADLKFWLRVLTEYDIHIIDEELVSYRISTTQGSQEMVRDRVDPWDYFIVMDDYSHLIDNHKNRHYFVVTQIKDMTVRSMNYSVQQDTGASMKLIRQSFYLYFVNFKKLCFYGSVLGCLIIQFGLCIVNLFPFNFVRKVYKRLVWDFIFIKKRLISY